MNHSPVVTPVHFLKKPEDISNLPVLTDVLVACATPSGRILWLAWDERRVPVLDEVIEAQPAAAFAPMRLWRHK